MDLPFNQRTALVSWSVPNPGPGFQRIAGPSFSQRFYPVGTNTTIRYIFNNGTDDYKCTFTIIVGPDPTPCTQDMVVYILRGSGGTIVTWDEPTASNRFLTTPAVPSGTFLPPGITCVSYLYNNTFDVAESCTFTIEVVEVNPCDDLPCNNNGRCLATSASLFQCICTDGCYFGTFCEISINACSGAPCANGGTCELFEGSCTVYRCECPPCYHGPRCETPLDPCSNSLCKAGSTCIAAGGWSSCDRYKCECGECVYGAFCEFAIPNPCDSSLCVSGFTCVRNVDDCSGYICESSQSDPSCVSGGIEIPIRDRCLSYPCKNQGVCSNIIQDRYEGFVCLCPDGYGGVLCAERLDNDPSLRRCFGSTCQNGAVCYNSYIEFSDITYSMEYTCVCEPGYAGRDCSRLAGLRNPCTNSGNNSPCLNPGVCRNMFISPDNEENFFCDCLVGFAGSRCERPAEDPCASSPCQTGGVCTSLSGYFRCSCPFNTNSLTCENIPAIDITPPIILNCPMQGLIFRSATPTSVTWALPIVTDPFSGTTPRLVSANALPGAVYNPGHFQTVVLVYEDGSGNQAVCEFWIYVEPIIFSG
ncbi:uncharacterized protein [Apostichopus japonicus]|uniref:uncharacterized protein n=1 Tax=Stichopus japonicus TaxID=307972 RepID=UPI003AB139C6